MQIGPRGAPEGSERARDYSYPPEKTALLHLTVELAHHGEMATKTKKSAALAPYRAPRAAAPIVVRVPSGMTNSRKKKHKGGGGGRRQSTEKVLMGLVVGGFAMGFLDKPGGPGANIPTIPVLGKAGTIALAAHFFGKGKAGLATDVRNAAAVVAAYEYGLKGSVSGDGEVIG